MNIKRRGGPVIKVGGIWNVKHPVQRKDSTDKLRKSNEF